MADALPPFSCESAARHLGHPDGKVTTCRKLDQLDLYTLFLADPSLPEGGAVFDVCVRGGAPVEERGDAAVARFLRDAKVWTLHDLDIRDVGAVLRALDGFPKGYDFEAIGFELPGVGTSELSFRPFRLTLYRPLLFGRDQGEAVPGATRYERAALAYDERADEFTWTIEHQERAKGPFVRTSSHPLD